MAITKEIHRRIQEGKFSEAKDLMDKHNVSFPDLQNSPKAKKKLFDNFIEGTKEIEYNRNFDEFDSALEFGSGAGYNKAGYHLNTNSYLVDVYGELIKEKIRNGDFSSANSLIRKVTGTRNVVTGKYAGGYGIEVPIRTVKMRENLSSSLIHKIKENKLTETLEGMKLAEDHGFRPDPELICRECSDEITDWILAKNNFFPKLLKFSRKISDRLDPDLVKELIKEARRKKRWQMNRPKIAGALNGLLMETPESLKDEKNVQINRLFKNLFRLIPLKDTAEQFWKDAGNRKNMINKTQERLRYILARHDMLDEKEKEELRDFLQKKEASAVLLGNACDRECFVPVYTVTKPGFDPVKLITKLLKTTEHPSSEKRTPEEAPGLVTTKWTNMYDRVVDEVDGKLGLPRHAASWLKEKEGKVFVNSRDFSKALRGVPQFFAYATVYTLLTQAGIMKKLSPRVFKKYFAEEIAQTTPTTLNQHIKRLAGVLDLDSVKLSESYKLHKKEKEDERIKKEQEELKNKSSEK